MAYGKIKADTITYDNSGSDVDTTIASLVAPKEGTAIISTGESGGTKFLREDGDNSCSWQAVPVPTSITVADESSDTTCFPLFVTAATGNLAPKTGTNITFNASTGKLVIGGDLQVDGTTTTVNSSTLTVTDKNIEIAKGAANDAAADGAGITVDSGDGDKTWNWVDATDAWTSSEHIHLLDSKLLKLGTDSDFSIFSDGSDGYVRNTTGNLNIQIKGGENAIVSVPDGGVKLYYDNIQTFETINGGIKVNGTEGQAATIGLYADEGDDNADKWIIESDTSGNFKLSNLSTGSWVTGLTLTGSNDATFAGHIDLADSKRVRLGTGNDLSLLHDGTNSYIFNDTGDLNIDCNSDCSIRKLNGDKYFQGVAGGATNLYYNGIKTFETIGSGILVQGTEGANGSIYLYADEGDDNGDKWQVQAATDGGYKIKSYAGGSWSTVFTLDGGNSGNVISTGSISDSKGDVRTIPQLSKSAQHTIVASDSGKHSINSSGGWIINTSTGFTAGQAVTLINNSGSDQTVTNTGCTMYLANDTTAKSSLTLKGRGMATFICTASNVYYGSGAGLE